MSRWCRLFGSQYLGFWAVGLVLFALQEVPYMLRPLFHPERDPIMHMEESSAALNALEKILGVGCIAAMIFIVRDEAPFLWPEDRLRWLGFFLAMLALGLNYLGWGLYFRGHQSLGVMVFYLAALPPLYYVFIGLWRGNPILLIAGALFTPIHVLHVYNNLKAQHKREGR